MDFVLSTPPGRFTHDNLIRKRTSKDAVYFRISRRLPGMAALLPLVWLCGCGGGGGGSGGNSPPPPPPPPPAVFEPKTTFTEVTAQSGILHSWGYAAGGGVPDPVEIGGGIAAVDFDDDGDIDLYLVGGDASPNRLYRNDGGGRFTDVAAALGIAAVHLGSGPVFGDLDGDADLDLFTGSVVGDPWFLFRNDAGTFVDVSQTSGIAISSPNTISASLSDYDLDGDLDLFLAHWGTSRKQDTETLWQNNGDGTFTTASVQSGIAAQIIGPTTIGGGDIDFSFSPVFSDIDNDGDPDILLASDFKTSKVFRNEGDGTFQDISDRNVIVDRNGMGNAVGDYDNDGDMDWFVTSIIEPSGISDANIGNRLYRNRGNGAFEDVTDTAGVADGGWGWGACMEDFDLDGDLDIFHVNGWRPVNPRGTGTITIYETDQVRYFESQGNGRFVETATDAGLLDTGQGRGAVCFDYDRDGDQDIVITNNNETRSVVVYRNDYNGSNHYLAIRLHGAGPNTRAIGARIELNAGSLFQVREIRAGNHFVSQGPDEAHFGLGAATSANVTVRWPDGSVSNHPGIAAGQLLVIDQP